ncbi:AMP-binding protein [Streptomyces sp. NRRL B-1677]|uniref:Long-chain fatty acid--CoA ligase n=1 Tax=Streptomyces klenkii TaxID=1420899 RepID=A0A3B0C2A3_9ACTN|nr:MULTISPECIES: class I adenylate-forming enzyme family protein [Streptomyces]MBF6049575.1 AMP-binding protein [Streptomyces sp. NRRL B-1677]RKN77516.1 long-chain fatty acid--CoA ligase [Streptomyces klenkii]
MPDPTHLLHDLLDQAAARWPDRPAVTSGDHTLSYRELDAASRCLAAWMHASGLRRGDRLVVCAPGSTALPPLVYAASRAGVAFSLLHEQVHGIQLDHVLDDCEPALLVTDDTASQAAAQRRGLRTATTGEIAALAFAAAPVPASVPEAVRPGPLTVDPVCLIYTSGTTSLPKAVVSTHQQLTFSVDAIQTVLNYRPDDVVYSPLPLSFDYGLYQLFLATRAGARVVLGRPAEVGPALLGNLVRAGATVLAAVPSVADALARLLRRAHQDTPPLRLLTNTGAAMPGQTLQALRAALPDLRVQLMFGLTECKRATIMPPDGDLERPGSSGRALPGTEVFVIGEDGRRKPPGEVGEIVVRGPNVMAGYWRRPELTAQRFHRVEGLLPQLHTGDYGWVDEEGFLYFDGRRDDIYKENGFRVSATEVEAAARRVPGVSAAAVLPPQGATPALLFAVSEPAAGEPTPAEVLQGMREQIEEFKIPRRCLIVAALPLTGNGKVDRKALAALTQEVTGARAQ